VSKVGRASSTHELFEPGRAFELYNTAGRSRVGLSEIFEDVLEDFDGEGGEADAVGVNIWSEEESGESLRKVDVGVCEGVRLDCDKVSKRARS
jgi:hypothetical protein